MFFRDDLQFINFSKIPINREEHKKVVRIIHNLLNMQESVNFRKPVCYRALGLDDYKDIVKKPIDLNMIRRTNNQWKYKYVEEALDDIQLCWNNCRAYNKPDSEIYEAAVVMERNFVDELKKQYPDYQIPEGIIRGRETITTPVAAKVDKVAEKPSSKTLIPSVKQERPSRGESKEIREIREMREREREQKEQRERQAKQAREMRQREREARERERQAREKQIREAKQRERELREQRERSSKNIQSEKEEQKQEYEQVENKQQQQPLQQQDENGTSNMVSQEYHRMPDKKSKKSLKQEKFMRRESEKMEISQKVSEPIIVKLIDEQKPSYERIIELSHKIKALNSNQAFLQIIGMIQQYDSSKLVKAESNYKVNASRLSIGTFNMISQYVDSFN